LEIPVKTHLTASLSAIALVAALALPAMAADSTTNAAAGVNAGVNAGASAAGVDATTTASTSASGSFTVDNVTKDKPFGDITFDQSQTPDQATMSLSDAQKQELQSRCDVIANNPTAYNNDTSSWCTTYLNWWKQNHPNG
jgi:hypothetical protein